MATSNNVKFAQIIEKAIASNGRSDITISELPSADQKFVRMFLDEPETRLFTNDANMIPGRLNKLKRETGLVLLKNKIPTEVEDTFDVVIRVLGAEGGDVIIKDTRAAIEDTLDMVEDVHEVVDAAAGLTKNPKIGLISKLLGGLLGLFGRRA